MSRQDDYVAQMKLRIDELNTDLKALEARADAAKQHAKDRYDAEMTKLREQSRLANAKLAEVQTAAEGSWDKMVAEMDRLQHAFTSSFHYFKSQV